MSEKSDLFRDRLELNAVNICKSYKDANVISDFSFSISSGEVIGLVGDNGTGKSTIMRIAALVDMPDSGDVIINGKKAAENIKQIRRYIGYIPQSNALIDEMTALDNLKLFSLLGKAETKKRIDELSDAFDMESYLNKKVKHLSGGMKRRVNISAGLINSPKLIVADEPFAGLDKSQREKVIAYFKRLSDEGAGMLISSHYIENLKDWSKSIISL